MIISVPSRISESQQTPKNFGMLSTAEQQPTSHWKGVDLGGQTRPIGADPDRVKGGRNS